jgi:hypothetical protein
MAAARAAAAWTSETGRGSIVAISAKLSTVSGPSRRGQWRRAERKVDVLVAATARTRNNKDRRFRFCCDAPGFQPG